MVGSECAEWYRTSGTFTDFLRMRCFDGLGRAPFMDRAWLGADARYEPLTLARQLERGGSGSDPGL
ncbi:hypothetical protein ACFVJM_27630 [Streptomyces virginiae]|uniref:hypothetical protein n=1 Tax=Streptomyces virginiae TaxID=1961 RepID=UPI003627EE97